MSVTHAEFSIERNYDCSPRQAFRGFSDPELKRQWFANPGDWPNAVWELDFRVGGGEVSGGGEPGGRQNLFRSTYHEIVDDERIVFAYDLLHDDRLISVSLTTVEFFGEEGGTRLLFTEQGAFFDELDDPAAREHGTGWFLDRLGKVLAGGDGPMTLTLHEHPFAAYCWKALIALYEREVPFERHFIGGEEDRAALAQLWPPASIPVLQDEASGLILGESTTIVEYLDRVGEAPPLIPADPDAALKVRLWDRVLDGQVLTPMQKIVADSLRPEGSRDEYGVEEAHGALDSAYELLDGRLAAGGWVGGSGFSLADCAAAPSLHYAYVLHRWDEDRLAGLTRYFTGLMARPSVARVVDEAREYRELFPLPWPEYAA